jgi:hypothetical protein
VSSECTSERTPALTWLKNASTNLWQKMADDAFRKLIWCIYEIASICKIISATAVKDPPMASAWPPLMETPQERDGGHPTR